MARRGSVVDEAGTATGSPATRRANALPGTERADVVTKRANGATMRTDGVTNRLPADPYPGRSDPAGGG